MEHFGKVSFSFYGKAGGRTDEPEVLPDGSLR